MRQDGETVTFTCEDDKKYNVTHEFQSATEGMDLPDAVTALTPGDQTGKHDGQTVTPTDDFARTVTVDAGKWTFQNWDADEKTIQGADQHFIGYWVYTPNTTEYPKKTETDPGAGVAVDVGDTITYKIEYQNWYNDSHDVIVTDRVPTGTEFVSASDGGSLSGGTVTWNVGSVAPGVIGSVSMTVRVTEDAGTSVANEAKVKIGDHDPEWTGRVENPVNEYKVTHEFVSGTPGKDLPQEIVDRTPGDQTGKKNGETVMPDDTFDHSKLDVEDGAWSFQSWDADDKTIDHADEKFTGTWVFTPKDPVDPEKTETDPGAGQPVDVGDTITYQIQYTNWLNVATTVTVTDSVPAGTEFVSASDGGSNSGGTVTWTIADVAKDSTGTVTLTVTLTVKVTSDAGKTVQNQATVKIGDHDPQQTAQVENPIKEYNVTHEFVSGTPGKELPKEVVNRTPKDQTGKKDGETVKPGDFDDSEVKVDGGKWVFKKWDAKEKTIDGADEKFTGTWVFVPEYKVTHEFASGTPGKTLPDAVRRLIPGNQTGKYDGDTVHPTGVTTTRVNVEGGAWVFRGWDADSKTIDGADQHFLGTWVFVETTYISVSGTKTWDDNDDALGKRPDSITINLLRNGEVVDSRTISVADGWRYAFDELPETDGNCSAYVYSIREVPVAGYYARVSGYDVTNTLIPDRTLTPNQPEDSEGGRHTGAHPDFSGYTIEELEELVQLDNYATPLLGILSTGDELPAYPFVFGGIGALALAVVIFSRRRKQGE